MRFSDSQHKHPRRVCFCRPFSVCPDTCLVKLSCTSSLKNVTFKASLVSGFKKVQIPDLQPQRDGESVPADHSLHVTALYDSQGLQACINKLWDVLSHWPTGGGVGGLSHVFFCIRKNSNIVNEHVGLWEKISTSVFARSLVTIFIKVCIDIVFSSPSLTSLSKLKIKHLLGHSHTSCLLCFCLTAGVSKCAISINHYFVLRALPSASLLTTKNTTTSVSS